MITVVICTFNRKHHLKNAIESLRNQTLSPELFELIIVDNNSTDGTKEFIQNNYKNLPFNIKYVLETNQGLSYSRNTGIDSSKYDYIAFLEDDGIAEPKWLELMLKEIKVNNKNFACATGDVIPIWEIPKPPWLFPVFNMYYSIFQLSEERFVFAESNVHTPAGGNVVYKKQILLEFGGFNTRIGRSGKNLISGEETLLHKQMIKKGYELIYNPDIRIKHHIHKSRINKFWLLRRSFWGGYSVEVMNTLESNQQTVTKYKKFFSNLYKVILNCVLIPPGFFFKPKYYYIVYLSRLSKSLGILYYILSFK